MASAAPALAPPTAPASTIQAAHAARSERWLVAGILAAFVILSVAYSLVVPAFETPDEIYHYAFARHLAQGNGLPVQSDQATGPWQQDSTASGSGSRSSGSTADATERRGTSSTSRSSERSTGQARRRSSGGASTRGSRSSR